MAYKYIKAGLAVKAKPEKSPKNQYIELFQQTLNDQFYNSSDWWIVEEETPIGSKKFAPIDVRINHLINAETGLKLGDDWKTVLFKEINHPVELGRYYRFDDNTWLTVNTEIIKNLTGTCTIRRCNNTLRWQDEKTGAIYIEPCAIEYMVKEPRNYITGGSPFPTPGGFLQIQTQFNEITNKITANQRFLFGNQGHWTCYRVVGTGLNDFRNMQTYNNESAKVLTIEMVADFVNYELDDIINGIANINSSIYSVSLNLSSAAGLSSDNIQLIPTIIYNGNTVTRDMKWTSSNPLIATVDNNGLVTLKAIGNCIITANVVGNPASANCEITVSSIPADNYSVILTPDKNFILEGKAQTFSVYLYKNNAVQSDTFSFTCDRHSVPLNNFVFTVIDGNHFSINNKLRDVSSYLTVNCVSGSNSKSFNIYLRGAW